MSAAQPVAYRAGHEIGAEWLTTRIYRPGELAALGRHNARYSNNRPARAFWLGVAREARKWHA